jgi:hypothetical protein
VTLRDLAAVAAGSFGPGEGGFGLEAGHGVAGAAGLVERAGEGLQQAVAHGVAAALVDLGAPGRNSTGMARVAGSRWRLAYSS